MNSQLELGNVVVVDNLGFGIAGEVSSQFHDLHTVKERGHMFSLSLCLPGYSLQTVMRSMSEFRQLLLLRY